MGEHVIGSPRIGRSHLTSHSPGKNLVMRPQLTVREAGKSRLAGAK